MDQIDHKSRTSNLCLQVSLYFIPICVTFSPQTFPGIIFFSFRVTFDHAECVVETIRLASLSLPWLASVLSATVYRYRSLLITLVLHEA